MADVFLSYSRLDRLPAEAIAQALEAHGCSVWWDRKITVGDSFDKTIERELNGARCVLVLWSASSIDSDWVKNEAAAAVERGALVPVMIDAIRLPIEFRRKQTIDLSQWDRTATDAALAPLLQAIAERLNVTLKPPLQDDDELNDIHHHRFQLSKRARWMLGVGAMIVAIASIAALPLWSGLERSSGATTDYTLVCQAGGPFGVRHDGVLSARIAFMRGALAASEALLVGQCSWTDRPLNANEPTEMCYSGPYAFTLSRRFAGSGLIRQQVHFDAQNRCMRITNLL